jgi:hypothetical protein
LVRFPGDHEDVEVFAQCVFAMLVTFLLRGVPTLFLQEVPSSTFLSLVPLCLLVSALLYASGCLENHGY